MYCIYESFYRNLYDFRHEAIFHFPHRSRIWVLDSLLVLKRCKRIIWNKSRSLHHNDPIISLCSIREQEEMRNSQLQQVMLPEARERYMRVIRLRLSSHSSKLLCWIVSRIDIVNPEKGREVGDCILQMAQKVQISKIISEERLIQL